MMQSSFSSLPDRNAHSLVHLLMQGCSVSHLIIPLCLCLVVLLLFFFLSVNELSSLHVLFYVSS